ncbi:hypothetical protein KAJ27_22140 [bacterium]|nr:hypothetical protein [bacterium]
MKNGFKLTAEHKKLLYLLSKYSSPALRQEDNEKWIRSLPLQVFMHEGIIKGLFDWDYAPASVDYLGGREFLNVSQEGLDDINDLREFGYANGMKISTNKHNYLSAFQISKKGKNHLEEISEEEQDSIDKLIICDHCKNLLNVSIREDGCFIVCECTDYNEILSSITDIEDVSYISSPYIPGSLIKYETKENSVYRKSGFHNEDHTGNNIKDTLDELIILSDVKVMIGEWIPFGANHIVLLNTKLGSAERVKSALFTHEIDNDCVTTSFELPPGLTQVFVRDYDTTGYINFDASLASPESDGIRQIEEFGVHTSSFGRCIYGLNIEDIAAMGKEHVSVDHLARLISDVIIDSTMMMNTLLTAYQKNLLNLVFRNCAEKRDKYTFVIAKNMDPNLSMEQLLDKEAYENELKQITDEVTKYHTLEDGSILVIGIHGALLVTTNMENYEHIISDFLFIKSFDIFLQNFFSSLFILNDTLRDIRKDVEISEEDPNAIDRVQQMLSESSLNAVLMGETLGYLEESLKSFLEEYNVGKAELLEATKEIAKLLKVRERVSESLNRIEDLKKIICGTLKSLDGMREISEVISSRRMQRVQEALQSNTRNLQDVTKSSERQGASLEFVEIILSGALAFDILDRLTGEWTVMDASWAKKIMQPIIDFPLGWLVLSCGLWFVIAKTLMWLTNRIQQEAEPVMLIKKKVNMEFNFENMKKFLMTKNLLTQDCELYSNTVKKKITYREEEPDKWCGNEEVNIDIVYGENSGFIYDVTIEIQNPGKTDSIKIVNIFMDELKSFKVI